MSTALDGESIGWFGKIPALGDFVTRRLPSSFVEPWDEWLSRELSAAERSLADAWESTYDRAPIVCFSVSNGIVGAQGWHGILVPSTDRVGRRFPLTIACAAPDAVVSLPGAPWWTALVAAGRQASNPQNSVDDLEEALRRLPACGERYVTSASASVATAAAAVREPGGGGWWQWSSDDAYGVNEVAANVALIREGLPRGASFRELLALERDESPFRRPSPKLMEN